MPQDSSKETCNGNLSHKTALYHHETSFRQRHRSGNKESNWQTPDDFLLQSLNNIFSIAISKTINNAIEDGVSRDLRHQISKQLSDCWSQDTNPESFRSRLKVTQLPLSLDLDVLGNVTNDAVEVKNVLSAKELSDKQKMLDAYLIEEIKQLNGIKEHFFKMEQDRIRDHAALKLYRESVENLLSLMDVQVEELQHEMKLGQEVGDEGISLVGYESISDFNPNEDSDVSKRLQVLQSKLSSLLEKSASLRSFNDRLESVYNLLD